MTWKHPLLAAVATVALGLPTSAFAQQDEREVPTVVTEARVQEQGRGKLSFQADQKGQVWAYDLTANKPVHSMTINPGNRYTIVPEEDQILFNDQPAGRFDLKADRIYQIYFVTDELRDKKHDSPQARSENIPQTAQVVAEGRNEHLSYQPKYPGKLFVWDATQHKIATTFDLQEGQRLTVAPQDGRISLADKVVAQDIKLDPNNSYKLLFDISHSALVPKDAQVVAQGQNKDLSYQARQPGTLYLWNADSDRLLTTFGLEQGQRLTVAPTDNAISLDAKPIAPDIKLDAQANYKLLFSPEQGQQATVEE